MREEVRIESTEPALAPSVVRRASWGAIFAGVFVTIILQIILTVLGLAIGVASLHVQPQGIHSLQTASGIWLLVTGLIATWIGSWVAGRLSGGPLRTDGMVHGIVSWSVATVTALYIMASAVGAALGMVGSALSGVASPLISKEENSTGQAPESAQPGEKALAPTGRDEGQSPTGKLTQLAAQDPELGASVAKMEKNGGASKDAADRDETINLLKTKHNLSEQDAQNMVNQWDQDFQQTRAKTGQAVNEGAHKLAEGAWWAFIALVLGLIFAAWGGWVGAASVRVLSTTMTEVRPTPVR